MRAHPLSESDGPDLTIDPGNEVYGVRNTPRSSAASPTPAPRPRVGSSEEAMRRADGTRGGLACSTARPSTYRNRC
jgi:hypothetical protein